MSPTIFITLVELLVRFVIGVVVMAAIVAVGLAQLAWALVCWLRDQRRADGDRPAAPLV